MNKREFIFELKEIVDIGNEVVGRKNVVQIQTGMAYVDENGEVRVIVDDLIQPHGQFESKDSFFNKIIKKIHKATGGK